MIFGKTADLQKETKHVLHHPKINFSKKASMPQIRWECLKKVRMAPLKSPRTVRLSGEYPLDILIRQNKVIDVVSNH